MPVRDSTTDGTLKCAGAAWFSVIGTVAASSKREGPDTSGPRRPCRSHCRFRLLVVNLDLEGARLDLFLLGGDHLLQIGGNEARVHNDAAAARCHIAERAVILRLVG